MSVHSLIYTSTAAVPVTGELLIDLLSVAKSRNSASDITGHLVYTSGAFIQELEGPLDAVEAVYASIEADPRHRDLHLLLREKLPERAYPDWSMSMLRLSSQQLVALGLPGVDLRSNDRKDTVEAEVSQRLRSAEVARELLLQGPPMLSATSRGQGIDGTNWVFLRA